MDASNPILGHMIVLSYTCIELAFLDILLLIPVHQSCYQLVSCYYAVRYAYDNMLKNH